jgi:hypothetical protein
LGTFVATDIKCLARKRASAWRKPLTLILTLQSKLKLKQQPHPQNPPDPDPPFRHEIPGSGSAGPGMTETLDALRLPGLQKRT